jgi:hypothetical protein
LLVAPDGEAVDPEGVGEQVEVLALMADGAGSAEPAALHPNSLASPDVHAQRNSPILLGSRRGHVLR